MTAPSGRRTTRLDPDELAALEEQRDFLLRSLADLERERDAGDLADDDFAELRDDYTARAAEVLRAIEAQEAAFAAARRPRDPKRTAAVVGGVLLFAVVAGWLVADAMGARKAGESASGGVSVASTPSQEALECRDRMGRDAPADVIECFQAVLDRDPDNAVAATWLAWQIVLAAPDDPDQAAPLLATAEGLLQRAVERQPSYSPARAFRVVVAYRSGRFEDAKARLDEFEASEPSAEAVGVLEDMGMPDAIDDALEQAGSTTTTTTTTTTTAPG